MCSMDRIENTNCSQLDFFREMQLTVNLSSHPACIRLRDGSFSHFNHSFATTFLHNINVNIWFNRLEISSSLRLSALDAEVYSGDRKMLVEENLPINGNRWDFIIERMSFDGTEFTLWKFCHLQRGGFLLSPVRSGFIKKLNELTKLCCIAEKGNSPRKKCIRKPRSSYQTSWFYFLNKSKQSIFSYRDG